ncbi:TauD/TfdA family dioxygenase [Phaeobacter marinintestinus]|uniref:TauD/TfdA family dioxygenase n=1 Tax=Falsiphaeobacter marinintestinus TaxID=1492905 RepID=UPI0011B6C639|nr:TauD/TfdA family dioxygenase [Phaeobacter marinintestinus]
MSLDQLAPMTDHANWTGADIASGGGWLFALDDAEIQGLTRMAAKVRPVLNGDPNALLAMTRDQFDLGPFGDTLARVYTELKSGLGIALIRGLPIETLDPLDAAIIYWGVGCHLGAATPNNPEGDMLGHITDLGKTQKDANSRGYQTRELMDYHCDQCDIVGLLCIRTAKSGGVSMVSSSVAMYNELLDRHPQAARALTEPLCWSKHGEHGERELPYYQSPVFNFFDGQICTSFGPKHIEKGHKLPGTPPLSDVQRDAIRKAEEIAHEQRYEMTMEAGDMQFVNNYVALHTRSEYQDHNDPARKRLLWRLWLMNPDLRHRTAYSMQWQGGVKLGAGKTQIRL